MKNPHTNLKSECCNATIVLKSECDYGGFFWVYCCKKCGRAQRTEYIEKILGKDKKKRMEYLEKILAKNKKK